jgi:hypothetical protein
MNDFEQWNKLTEQKEPKRMNMSYIWDTIDKHPILSGILLAVLTATVVSAIAKLIGRLA